MGGRERVRERETARVREGGGERERGREGGREERSEGMWEIGRRR